MKNNLASYLILLIALSDDSIKQNSQMQLNWNIISKNNINKNCSFNKYGRCVGLCGNNLRSRCVKLFNNNQRVCGCRFCALDKRTKKCYGQCKNLLLGSCQSRISIPESDMDCQCTYCSTNLVVVKREQILKCNPSTCYSKQCKIIMKGTNKSGCVCH